MTRLSCFKSYDVRGRLGEELDEALMHRIGRAFAQVTRAERVVTGRDVRPTSPALQAALVEGLRDEGTDVLDLGLCGTEEVYFATAHTGAGGGLMVTASHNPIDYNGLKIVREGARPIAWDTGLKDIHDLVVADRFGTSSGRGTWAGLDLRPAYAAHVASYLDPAGLRPLRVLVNAGHGAAGPTFDAIAAELARRGVPFDFVRLDHEPDPTFPQGIPNPLLPENRARSERAVREAGADMGVVWDGDFDRCFLFDERGGFIDGEYVVALLARAFLAKEPGAPIVHEPRVIWATQAMIEEAGGRSVICRTGHAHLKAALREQDAPYGGEMSAHHYFRDFAYCDSGMIPWLLVAGLLARQEQPLSALVDDLRTRFPSSGEINFALADPAGAIARFEAAYGAAARSADRLDGLSLDMGDWRANVRMSNTESLLRLNIEARGDRRLLEAKVAEVSALLAG
ncbi:phosphomannomutase [Rubellimicrobium aerolatum]|uniref:Phosphomannomutase n=1 Tax=Rubellimicrobium aerolatum TaxID=490979 RepID=A0ABW0SBD4_9RHOB|nr:phosphomannomutase [Rubellimicrobium aerolatum]MBP1805542.1 phosphomannomutase [Rubellimicrobium aerolatum]